MFTPWEEMNRNEQLHAEYYDFYKEVHGVRPRWIYIEDGQPGHTEQEMEQMLHRLAAEAKEVFAAEAAAEQENVAKFEEQVLYLCKALNKDRETVVRWMFDSSDSNGARDYYCFSLGIPYNYFKEFYEKEAA